MILGILPEQGGSLENLQKTGQETRFLANYIAEYINLSGKPNFDPVHYFSYGDQSTLREQIDGHFRVWPNPGIHRWAYAFLLPIIHRRTISQCSVLRVMQATGAIPAHIARILYGVPYVITYGYDYAKNAPEGFRGRFLARRALWALRHADGVIAPSYRLFEHAMRFTDESKICLVPNSVDTDLFRPCRPSSPPVRKRTHIISVGALKPVKNYRLLIEAAAHLSPKPVVTIVGEGSERCTLRELALKHRVDLFLPGIQENCDLPTWFSLADVFCLPSNHEGCPKALLEAMSCGLSCVGTDVPGINDIIAHNITGRLCEPTVDSLTRALKYVLRRPGIFGGRARKFILASHNWRDQIEYEIEFLKSVARKPND